MLRALATQLQSLCTAAKDPAWHSEEKLYECKVCGKAFTQYAGLNQHQRIHSERNLLNVLYVVKLLAEAQNLQYITEFTQGKNLMNVLSVEKPLE